MNRRLEQLKLDISYIEGGVTSLANFIGSKEYFSLPFEEGKRLIYQLILMRYLVQVLKERVSFAENKEVV